MTEQRTLEIELSPLEWRRMELLCESLNRRDGSSLWREGDLAGRLLGMAMEGATRPGGWEHDVLERILWPFEPVEVPELLVSVSRWKTASGRTIGWLGELVNDRGAALCRFDGCPSRDAAVLAVLQSLGCRSAIESGRELLFDVPELTPERAAEESDEVTAGLMRRLRHLWGGAAADSEYSRQLERALYTVTARLDCCGDLLDDWHAPCHCRECLSVLAENGVEA